MARNDMRPEEATSNGANFSLPAQSSRERYAEQDAILNDVEGGAHAEKDVEEELMEVIVKMVGNTQDTALLVSQDASVLDLKTSIHEELAVPAERQRLIFSGRMLSNDDDFLVHDVKMNVESSNYVHLAPLPERATQEPTNGRREPSFSRLNDEYDGFHVPPFFDPYRDAPYRRPSSREARRMQASPYRSPARHAEGTRAPYRGQPRHSPPQGIPPPAHGRPTFGTSLHQPSVPVVPPPFFGLSAALPCQGPPPPVLASFGPPPMGLIPDAALLTHASVPPPPLSVPPSLDIDRQAQVNGIIGDLYTTRLAHAMIALSRDEMPQQLIDLFASTPGSNPSQIQELDYLFQLESSINLLEEVSLHSIHLADSLRRILQAREARERPARVPPLASAAEQDHARFRDVLRLLYQDGSLHF